MNFRQHKKTIIPLPYHYYYFTVAIIGLIGFCDSIYLSISHYRVFTDIGYESFCALSRAINCDTVSQSPYSIFLGVPVPVWGVLGYAFFMALLLYAWQGETTHRRVWSLLLLISIGFSTYSIVLALISTFWIHSYCIMCIFSYAVNLSLVYFVWLIRNRFQCEFFFVAVKLDLHYLLSFPKRSVGLIVFFGGIAILLLLSFPAYWHLKPPALLENVTTGITEDGHPWIGAEQPELEIIEFTDYQCFQCKKMHFFLRRLIEKNSDKIRLIHRHFPMDQIINPLVDQPYHAGSAKLALLAIFATDKQKFWEMNDLLFNISGNKDVADLKYFAEKTGIEISGIKKAFRDRKLWMRLQKDIKDGIQYGINGTPGFIINDQVYLGQIPPEILRKYLK